MGEELELRTRVEGGPVVALFLREEKADYRIRGSSFSQASGEDDPLRSPTCTEVVVRGIHGAALGALAGRRLHDYLGYELSGQLGETGVHLLIRDELARGRGARLFRVEPRALEGISLGMPRELEVSGYRPARLDLRALPEGSRGTVTLRCEGSVVADDLGREPALGLDHAPWTAPRLTGFIDFPDLTPAPGSRRGVVPNGAAEALRDAIVAIEKRVAEALRVACDAPARELEREALARLRRVFANLSSELPRYELLNVLGGKGAQKGARSGVVVAEPVEGELEPPSSEALAATEGEAGDPRDLATVKIAPTPVVVSPGGSRRIRAIARDACGRVIERDLNFRWVIDDPAVATFSELAGSEARIRAGERESTSQLHVEVTSPAGPPIRASGLVRVCLPAAQARSGVPDPVLVDDATGGWPTRMREGRWEVNASHRDYVLVRDRPELRVQYLAVLLAKEIVLRSEGGDARIDEALDAFSEVTAYALRQL